MDRALYPISSITAMTRRTPPPSRRDASRSAPLLPSDCEPVAVAGRRHPSGEPRPGHTRRVRSFNRRVEVRQDELPGLGIPGQLARLLPGEMDVHRQLPWEGALREEQVGP